MRSGGEQIPSSATTVAEAFREAGYLTAAFIRNDFVGPTTHTEQGFDFFFPGDVIGAPNAAALNNAVNDAFKRAIGVRPNPANADAGAGGMNFGSGSSRDLYAKVEPWLDQYRDVPFFLYMHAVDPHEPYDPDKADRAKYLSKEEDEAFVAMEKKFNDFQQAQQATLNLAGGNVVIGPGGMVMQIGGPPAAAPAPAPAATPTPDPNAATATEVGAEDKVAKKDAAATAATPDGATPPAAPPAAPPALLTAPPPGIVSSPASRRATSTSRTSSFSMRAMCAISTAVSALMCTCGCRSLSPRIMSV